MEQATPVARARASWSCSGGRDRSFPQRSWSRSAVTTTSSTSIFSPSCVPLIWINMRLITPGEKGLLGNEDPAVT